MDSPPPDLDAERERSLVQRIGVGLWLMLLTVCLYGLLEEAVFPDAPYRLRQYRVVFLGVVVAAQIALRIRPTRGWATGAALLVVAAACTATAATGNLTGDAATTALLAVALVILSATFLPWGFWPHTALVVITGVTTLWNVSQVQGVITPGLTLSGSLFVGVWLGAFYLLHEMEKNRRAVVRETLERKRAEDKAHQHQAALAHVARVSVMGELAGQLAHELNQPLSAIVSYAKGCTRRMQSGSGQPGEMVEVLDQISEQAVRASEILRRLREFVRKGEPRRERVQVNDVVRNAIHFAEVEAKDYGAAVRFNRDGHLPVVEADAIQLEQVVLNLVRNGFESMRESRRGELLVRTVTEGNESIRVEVCDAGCGIEADIVESLFEPFATTKPDGLGMGLSISRSIIESHGGRLWATPNTDGGTTFHFTLPIAGGKSFYAGRSNRFRR